MRLMILISALAVLSACNDAPDTAVVPGAPDVSETVPGEPGDEAPETVVDAGTPADGGYEPITFEGQTATPEERARCEAAGGEVRPAGRAQFENCIQTFDDAGESCSDASDCTGRCLVVGEMVEGGTEVSGQCAADDERFGCYQTITGGVADAGICVD